MKILFSIILSLFSIATVFSQVTAPTIQSCGSEQKFCIDQNTFDLCVKIDVPSGLPEIDRFEIDWGDRTNLTTIVGSNNPATQNHTYDLQSFFGSCTYEIEFIVKLVTFYTNGEDVNSLFIVTFRNPPQARFDFRDAVICAGDEACFRNRSCPTEQLEIVNWSYGDGTNGLDDCHVYNAVGNYDVTLTVKNPCGESTITQTLRVIAPPEAHPVPTNGVNNMNEPYIICLPTLSSPATVCLDGDSLSLNEDQYEWQSLSGVIGAEYLTDPPSNNRRPTVPDLKVVFSDTGLYNIILEVNNACDAPDLDTLTFRVLTGESLGNPNEPDACLELEYTPENFNPDATFTINGDTVSNFPIMLDTGNYQVIAFIKNECGPQQTIDNFRVFPRESVSILFPTDTTVCVGTDSILIVYTNPGGSWTGDHLSFMGDTTYFIPVDTGSFQLIYSKGLDACKDEFSITINVVGSNIMANDYSICSTSPPFQLTATPPGGTWTSSECPTCIRSDTFLTDQLLLLGLSNVEVTYETTGASLCPGGRAISVSIDDPLAEFTTDSIFCASDPIVVDFTSTNGNLTWLVDGMDAGSPPFIGLSTGAHTIELIAEAGNCDDRQTRNIFITTAPSTVSFEVDTLEGCADLVVTITNTTPAFDDEAYEWYIGDSLFSTASQPGTITLFSGISDTVYTIRLQAANDCNDLAVDRQITVFPKPITRFGPMKDQYCSGELVQFANVTTGGPMNSWLWDYGNGTTSTDSIPLDLIYFTDSLPRTYTITLTASNECGTEIYPYELTINPTDVRAFFNIGLTSVCVGEEICLTDLSTPGSQLLWNFGDGNTSTGEEICHTYTDPGTYTISLKAFGCGFDSIEQIVVVYPRPNVGFSSNTIACPGDTIVFQNLTTGASDYIWDFGDGNTSTFNNPENVYKSPGTYTAKLIATSSEGCLDSTISSVTILTPPQSNFILSTDSVCVGEEIQFTSISTTDPLTCFWDFGDGNFKSECDLVYSYTTSGSYIVSLIVGNNNGCRDTMQQLIYVSPVPEPSFSIVKDQNCSPILVSFINQAKTGESYFWDFGDGNTSDETAPTYIYSTGGNYTVMLTVISGVCSQRVSRNIEVNSTPEANIISPLGQTGCAPFEASLTSSPSGGNFAYKWDFGDGSFSFDENPDHVFDSPDTYQVILIVEDDVTGCADTSSIAIDVFEPVFGMIVSSDNLCFGDTKGTVNLNVESGTADFEFDWSNGMDTSRLFDLSAGNYLFTVTDNNGCTWSDSVAINQPDLPVSIQIEGEKIVTCFGGTDGGLTISAQGGTPGYNYMWASGSTSAEISNVAAGEYAITVTDANGCTFGERLNVQQNDSIEYLAEVFNVSCFGFDDGQINLLDFRGGVPPYFASLDTLQGTGFNGLSPGDYRIVISDGIGCTQTVDKSIVEPPAIFIELDTNFANIFLGEFFPIRSNHNVANPMIEWTPSEGLNCNNCKDPLAQPFNDVTYRVLVTDDNGCTATDEILITVKTERGIAIPNIFTPNNDGQNDVFTLLGRNPAVVEVLDFKIFDRYGGIMFESQNFELNDPTYGWDGEYKGKDAQVGQYIYQAIVKYIDGKSEVFKGSIMLSR